MTQAGRAATIDSVAVVERSDTTVPPARLGQGATPTWGILPQPRKELLLSSDLDDRVTET